MLNLWNFLKTGFYEGIIHDRMPVILPRELESLWLDDDMQDPAALTGVLTPYPAGKMEVYEVSTLVNSPSNDGPEVVAPVGTGAPWGSASALPTPRLGQTP